MSKPREYKYEYDDSGVSESGKELFSRKRYVVEKEITGWYEEASQSQKQRNRTCMHRKF
jgi:hypothetical protein